MAQRVTRRQDGGVILPEGMPVPRHAAKILAGLMITAALLLLSLGQSQAQPSFGAQPGHGYGKTTDLDGVPFMHGVVDQGVTTYATVIVGTTSTPVLAAPTVQPRTKLYLLNASGRSSGTAVDVWCNYGVPAGIGQGFILMGYGDRVTEDMGAKIDQRALSCIATSAVPINVGSVQQ